MHSFLSKLPSCPLGDRGQSWEAGHPARPRQQLTEGQSGHSSLWGKVPKLLAFAGGEGGPLSHLRILQWGNPKSREVKGLAACHTMRWIPCTKVSECGSVF